MLFYYRSAVQVRQGMLLLLLLVALSVPSLFVYSATHTEKEFNKDKALSLSDVVQKILKYNPSLQGFKPKLEQLKGLKQFANQAPGYQLGIETENVLGSGDYKAFDNTEVTVSLSSVIELGDKRRYRTWQMQSSYLLEQAKMKIKTLDILGEATQSFISLLTMQAQVKLAEKSVDLAATILKAAQTRVKKGAAFQADVMRSQVALAQAELKLTELQHRFQNSKVSLSVYWGESEPTFNKISGELFAFNTVKPYQQLVNDLQQTPALQVYADIYRVKNAELAVVKSASQSDISWQVGVKHNLANNDAGLNASFTMPMFAQSRNQGKIAAELAAKQSIAFQQQTMLLHLKAKLYQAYHTQQQQTSTVKRLKNHILPALEQVLVETSKAYHRGRYSYIEWIDAQQEVLNARYMMIQAASNVLRNQALIEQLTTQSLFSINSQKQPQAKPTINWK